MNFRIPFSISSMSSQANQLYPHAMCLKETIRTYELTCQKVMYMFIFVCVYRTTCTCTVHELLINGTAGLSSAFIVNKCFYSDV